MTAVPERVVAHDVGVIVGECYVCLFCVGHSQEVVYLFFFFNDTATTEIYTLSLHDALPILAAHVVNVRSFGGANYQ